MKCTMPLLLLLAMTFSCSKSSPAPDSSTNFERFKPIAKVIRQPDQLILYEGLPHQGFEHEVFLAERSRSNPITIHGELFYPQKIQPSANEMRAITAVFADSNSFSAYAGAKLCGAFHPDWCFEWQTGGNTYQGLLCLNCQEMKFFGPTPDLHCDILTVPAKSLKALVEQYRVNRPKSSMYDALLSD